MAFHTLLPLATASSPLINMFGGLNSIAADLNTSITSPPLFGSTDYGVCLQAVGDGNYINPALGTNISFFFFFEDDGIIPQGAAINSVQLAVRHHTTGTGAWVNGTQPDAPSSFGAFVGLVDSWVDSGWSDPAQGGAYAFPFISPAYQNFTGDPSLQSFGDQTGTSALVTLNPATAAPWSRADLFAATNQLGRGLWLINIQAPDGAGGYFIDYASLIVDYVSGAPVTSSGVTPALGSTLGGD